MKKINLILVLLFLAFFISMISVEARQAVKEDYNYNQKLTTYDNGGKSLNFYNGVRYVPEDGQWKKIEETHSLKDSGVYQCIVIEDANITAQCTDFNYTHRILANMSIKDNINANKDINVYKISKLSNGSEEKTKLKTIRFNNKNDKQTSILEARLDEEIHIGEKSTVIFVNGTFQSSTAGGFVQDGFVRSDLAVNWDATDIEVASDDGGGTRSRWAYFLMNLTGNITTSDIVSHANITLKESNGGGSNTGGVINLWNITNYTFTTAMDWADRIMGIDIVNTTAGVGDGGIITMNLTSLVKQSQVRDPALMLPFMINETVAGGSNGFQFYSSSNDTDTTFIEVQIDFTAGNTAPSLATAAVNVTNSTLSATGDWINASVAVTDSDAGNRVNVTARLYVNDVANITLNLFNNWATGTTASIVFNNTNITRGQRIEVQFNASDGTDTSNYINSSEITAANTAPTVNTVAINLTNSSTFTSDFVNASGICNDLDGEKCNVTFIFFVNDAVNITANHDGNYLSGATASYIFNNTNFTKGQVINMQFNITDGTASSDYLNSTKWTIANTAPSIASASLNVTNATLTVTSDFINSSVALTDGDAIDRHNGSVIFYVNDVANISINILNNYQTGQTVSYLFNNTNITKNQRIEVQFNLSDGTDTSNYLNTSEFTVSNTAPTISTPTLNESNNTLFRSMLINTSALTISDSDSIDTLNVSFRWYSDVGAARNVTSNNLLTPSDAIPNSLVLNKGQAMRVEVWAYDGTDNSTIINSTAITVNNSNPVWTMSNDNIRTLEDSDISNLNLTLNLTDRDNSNFNLNHTNIVLNGTSVASSCSITNGTHLITCTLVADANGYFQFNITSTFDNDTVPNIGNTTLSTRILVTPVNDAPTTNLSTVGNGTVITNDNTDLNNYNISNSFSDIDTNIILLNHTRIQTNDSTMATITITNATHLITVLPSANRAGVIELNITTLDNSTANVSYSFKVNITDVTAPAVNINNINNTKFYVGDSLLHFFAINFTANDTGGITSCTFFMDGLQANSSTAITSNVSQLIGNNSFYVKEWKTEVSCIDAASNRGSSNNVTMIVERTIQAGGGGGSVTTPEDIAEEEPEIQTAEATIDLDVAAINSFLQSIPYSERIVKNRSIWLLLSIMLILPFIIIKKKELLFFPAILLFVIFVKEIYIFAKPIMHPVGKFILQQNPILGFVMVAIYAAAVIPFILKKKTDAFTLVLIAILTISMLFDRLMF